MLYWHASGRFGSDPLEMGRYLYLYPVPFLCYNDHMANP